MKFHVYVAALAASASLVSAASKFSPARPPAIPLAGIYFSPFGFLADDYIVKSPYMQTWLEVGSDDGGSSGGNLAGYWP